MRLLNTEQIERELIVKRTREKIVGGGRRAKITIYPKHRLDRLIEAYSHYSVAALAKGHRVSSFAEYIAELALLAATKGLEVK